jgi:hypothetical protein
LSRDCSAYKLLRADEDTYYSWEADAESSVMSYLAVNDDFGQFDRDTLARNRLLDTLWIANQILADILASPRADEVAGAIASADAAATDALAAYDAMEYELAVMRALSAHRELMAAASAIHLRLDPAGWQPTYRSPTLRQDVREHYRAMLRREGSPVDGELAAAAARTLELALP